MNETIQPGIVPAGGKMPNIFDYLDWRGDLPLSADPFNDVDNLILAELAYTAFDGIVPDSGVRVPLQEARTAFFNVNSRTEIERSDDILAKTALLMDGMVTGSRYMDTELYSYVNIVDTESDLQMSAITYLLSDGSAYIAFRGTDNTVVGWKEDFNMSYMPETGGQREAIRYLDRVGSELDRPLRVGGHSKGGNFAVYAAAFCRPEIQDKITAVYTNDGPGFRNEVMEAEGYGRIIGKVRSIVPESSVIGLLLKSSTEPLIVDSSAKLLVQHDGMTWQVIRNGFIPAKQSDIGRFIRDTQTDWLSKLDDDTRKSFVNQLFSILTSTGADTFGEMKDQKLRSLERIFSSAQDMNRDKQKEMLRVAGELLQSGREIAMRSIGDSWAARDQSNETERGNDTPDEHEERGFE